MSSLTRILKLLKGQILNTNRHKKIRNLVKTLNTKRKAQARQIDILCNDIVSAHKTFTLQLNEMMYANEIFESLIGIRTTEDIISQTSAILRKNLADSNIAIYLKTTGKFEFHHSDMVTQTCFQAIELEKCFTPEIAENICKSNSVCNLNNLFEMGFNGSVNMLKNISLATIPMNKFKPATGFILIYKNSNEPLTVEDLQKSAIAATAIGKALVTCLDTNNIYE